MVQYFAILSCMNSLAYMDKPASMEMFYKSVFTFAFICWCAVKLVEDPGLTFRILADPSRLLLCEFRV